MRRNRPLHPGVEVLEPRLPLSADTTPYNIGTPTLTDIWVDPVNGSDSNTGATRSQALQSLAAAWNMIPQGPVLTGTGYEIMMTAGDYPVSLLPDDGWMSGCKGTYTCPVIIDAVDGPLTARIHGTLDCQNDSYLYMEGLNFVTDPGGAGGGNVVQFASDDHILVRSCQFNGFDGTVNEPQETFKANQCQYFYVESSNIGGAFWFGLDFVAVQYGHILDTEVHDTGDDGLVLKGGSAQITVEGCTIYNIGNVGFAAGQGSGFEFMVSPWLDYEAYDLKFVNNVIYNTQNAGMAVRGGYNILLADNTLYDVGIEGGSGSTLLLFSPGGRTDDGDDAACLANHNLGGWGPTTTGAGGEWIPNKDVDVYDNIIDDPASTPTMWGDFTIFGPTVVPAGTNIPSPALSDDNLQIAGNIIWNGSADAPLGDDDPTRDAQLLATNTFMTSEPQLDDPANGDFRPLPGGNVYGIAAVSIPNFPGGDAPLVPAPQGDLSNLVALDRLGNPRSGDNSPGAFIAVGPQPPYPSEILQHLPDAELYESEALETVTPAVIPSSNAIVAATPYLTITSVIPAIAVPTQPKTTSHPRETSLIPAPAALQETPSLLIPLTTDLFVVQTSPKHHGSSS